MGAGSISLERSIIIIPHMYAITIRILLREETDSALNLHCVDEVPPDSE